MKSTENNAAERTSEWYDLRTGYMQCFLLEERAAALERVLENRTRYATVCMENTFHPQNASALVRSCEAFGVQDIHTIEETGAFRPNVNIVRGTDKWVDIRRHRSTGEALASLKTAGYRIVATTPHKGDATPLDFDVAAGPFALVFGTEHAGVSEKVIEAADGFLKIPMAGFVDSLNVSASAAVILYNLTARMRSEGVEWQLTENEKAELRFRWTMRSVRDAEQILSKKFPV